MYIIIETTTDSQETSKTISKTLISKRLAACVQINDNIHSEYRWNGKVCNSSELLIRIKTLKNNYNDICLEINKHHNYDNPEIISYDIDILSNNYKDWFLKSLTK